MVVLPEVYRRGGVVVCAARRLLKEKLLFLILLGEKYVCVSYPVTHLLEKNLVILPDTC